jgi:hypothetical protein
MGMDRALIKFLKGIQSKAIYKSKTSKEKKK